MNATRTAAAIAARHNDTQAKIDRVTKAITRLRRDGLPATTAAVARAAAVSRSFLYQNPAARSAITAAVSTPAMPATQTDPAGPWRERALNAEAALKAAFHEIGQQRQRLADLLGRIRDLEADLPADATQRLLADNTSLRTENIQLTRENRTLAERLAAARTNLQSQDRMIADLQAQLLDPPRQLRPVR